MRLFLLMLLVPMIFASVSHAQFTPSDNPLEIISAGKSRHCVGLRMKRAITAWDKVRISAGLNKANQSSEYRHLADLAARFGCSVVDVSSLGGIIDVDDCPEGIRKQAIRLKSGSILYSAEALILTGGSSCPLVSITTAGADPGI
jgi:hypothetical protein